MFEDDFWWIAFILVCWLEVLGYLGFQLPKYPSALKKCAVLARIDQGRSSVLSVNKSNIFYLDCSWKVCEQKQSFSAVLKQSNPFFHMHVVLLVWNNVSIYGKITDYFSTRILTPSLIISFLFLSVYGVMGTMFCRYVSALEVAPMILIIVWFTQFYLSDADDVYCTAI